MKIAELYARMRCAVYIDGLNKREAPPLQSDNGCGRQQDSADQPGSATNGRSIPCCILETCHL